MVDDPIKTVKAFQAALRRHIPNKALSVEMTKAGANYVAQQLASSTRQEHYDPKHQSTFKRKDGSVVTVDHLANSVITKPGTITGKQNGSYTVGYDTSGVDHGRIARFLNDGTVHIKADYFVDKTYEEAAPSGFDKMFDVYNKHVNKD